MAEFKLISDPLSMLSLEDLIPEEINSRRKQLRSFLHSEIEPHLAKYIENAEFPFALLPKFKQIQIFGLEKAEFGCRQVSPLEKALTIYELARLDASLATFYVVQMCLSMRSIELLGSEEQKEKYLPQMIQLEKIGCFALTEPFFGSDASSLQTSTAPVKGGFVLNGTKRWIGNASHSDIMIVWARNTSSKQVQGFIVDSKSAGITCSVIQHKLSLRSVLNSQILFENVFVPLSHQLPTATDFANGVNKTLDSSRMYVAWVAIGIMAGTCESVFKFVKSRQQFDTPIGAFQLTQEKLARMLGHFNAAFLQGLRIITMENKKLPQISAIKAWTTLAGREVTKLAREIMGANGILIENYVMKAMMDMEAIYTYEGTYEINTLVAGKGILGISAFRNRPLL